MSQFAAETQTQTISAIPTLLERARLMCVSGQLEDLANCLENLSQHELTPEQALLLETLQIYPGVADSSVSQSQLLQRAMGLLQLAQAIGSPLAKAWLWELMQLLQMNLSLHHAALHSTANAVEMFELCERPQDALNMRVSRCSVMIHCEMYREVIAMSEQLLAQREALTSLTICTLLRSTASAYYFIGNESEGELAQKAWENALALHEECLELAQRSQFIRYVLISHTNIAILNATLGHSKETTYHLLKIESLHVETNMVHPSWPYWVRFCEVQLLCQSAQYQLGWTGLLHLAAELKKQDLTMASVFDAVLRKIVSLGRRWGHLEEALEASQTHVELNSQRRRLMAKALGETVDDIMSIPRLKQKNLELSEQGHLLENSLARRNAELGATLEELRAEVQTRQAAQSALKDAHDHLEEQVKQRSDELQLALQTVMRQEKQLALGRLVVGVAHEMSTPLGNARMAASTISHLCENLDSDLQGQRLSRSHLNIIMQALRNGNHLLGRSLQTASNLVQSFRALAIEQHEEQRLDFNVSERLTRLLENWQERISAQAIVLESRIEADVWQSTYPHALDQVIDQLIDNALVHGLQYGDDKRLAIELKKQKSEGALTLVIVITDNGLGIDPAIIDRVFEPFFSKQLGHDGIGLGLSIVHSVVTDLMQGQITIAHLQPQGCQVRLSFPMELPIERSPEQQDDVAHAPPQLNQKRP